MCIIIHKPQGVSLHENLYRRCFNGNPHGAGYSYVDDEGVLRYFKGLFKVEDLLAHILPLQERELIVHFRWATHGAKNEDNCHPWLIEGKHDAFAVHHNGVLNWRSTNELSDTGCFVADVLTPMLQANPDLLRDDRATDALSQMIGYGNKMVIHRNNGEVYYLNREEGVEDLDCWFSNHGYTDRFPPLRSRNRAERDYLDALADEFSEEYAVDRKLAVSQMRSFWRQMNPEFARLSDDEVDEQIMLNGGVE